jgi:hypothetical protein
MTPVDLDDFRWNLAAAYSVVKVTQLAVEGNPDTPQEAVWRTLAVAADLTEQCLNEFDSAAFAAAWNARKAVRS